MTTANISTEDFKTSIRDQFLNLVCEQNGYYSFSRPVDSEELFNCVKYLIVEKFKRKDHEINCSKDCKSFLTAQLSHCEEEIFAIIFLDTKNRIIEYQPLFKGTVNSCRVYPRVIIKKAMALNSAKIILAHNHPSGDPEPSQGDIELTKELSALLKKLDIDLLDHIIVGGADTISFQERHLI
jgi:DNA repair protein RadC